MSEEQNQEEVPHVHRQIRAGKALARFRETYDHLVADEVKEAKERFDDLPGVDDKQGPCPGDPHRDMITIILRELAHEWERHGYFDRAAYCWEKIYFIHRKQAVF